MSVAKLDRMYSRLTKMEDSLNSFRTDILNLERSMLAEVVVVKKGSKIVALQYNGKSYKISHGRGYFVVTTGKAKTMFWNSGLRNLRLALLRGFKNIDDLRSI